MTIRDRLRCRSIASRLRSAIRAYALAQLAEQARQIDPTATWSRPMLAFRPQVQARDPRASGPEEIVLDGQVIGTVTMWHLDQPTFVATVELGRDHQGIRMFSNGSGESPASALAKALANGVADHATATARARALEAQMEAVPT